MIIFDANNAKSFEDIDDWITQLRDLNDSAKLIIIANKNDLEWSTLKEDALEKAKNIYSKAINIHFFNSLIVPKNSRAEKINS